MKQCPLGLALSLFVVLCVLHLEHRFLAASSVGDLAVKRTSKLENLPTNLTSSPTTTATTLPPKDAYPVWNDPLPGQPTVSTTGDFEWIFPTIAANQTEYAKHRYVANEFNRCGGETELCCSVGATSIRSGAVGNGCQMDKMNLMVEFRPLPHRELFSLVDVLLVWRLAHPKRTSFHMLFIGDSITAQMFMGALCELARNSKVKSITYDADSTKSKTFKDFQESHIKLADGDEEFDFMVSYYRQYRWTLDRKTMGIYMSGVDVMLIGLGLHYLSPNRSAINEVLGHIASELPRNITAVWMGAPKQHFRFELNNTQVTGFFQTSPGRIKFCGPVARYPWTHPDFDAVNTYAFNYLTNTLNVSASWFRWNAVPSPTGLHFLPFAELTSPFHRNYKYYDPNPIVRSYDCSHKCWAPNFYEPYWDALYLIVAAGKFSPAAQRFPAGTQQSPPMLIWNQTLQFKAMLARLEQSQV
ncbi:hypothetical protein BASA81_005583 [Batrachochytrium salamandrivorans]|nr:hypothetical protein BASA81_005583 [Batrachochytrium salamandrivorans]